MSIQILHQSDESSLRSLLHHGLALDGLHFGESLGLRGFWEAVDVVEDVDGFGDVKDLAHLAEHVILGFAFCGS